jgi:hypothetical protein
LFREGGKRGRNNKFGSNERRGGEGRRRRPKIEKE